MYCSICGVEIEHKLRIRYKHASDQNWDSIINAPVCEDHRVKCKELLESRSDFDGFYGFCYICGKEYNLQMDSWNYNKFKHRDCRINPEIHRKLEITKYKKVHPHPLKPWQDPQSFFCDTPFLEELLKKKLPKGKECKDNHV